MTPIIEANIVFSRLGMGGAERGREGEKGEWKFVVSLFPRRSFTYLVLISVVSITHCLYRAAVNCVTLNAW